MNVYSLDIQLAATAYINADTAEQALEIARGLVNNGLEFSGRHQSIGTDICMDGRPFSCLAENDETVALSPAMTVTGTFNARLPDVELVEHFRDA